VQSRISPFLTVALAFAAGSFAACAPPRAATTSLTAAELPALDSREAAVEAAPSEAARASADRPAGQLACRSKDTFGVVLEVHVDGAKGTLRRVSPSGMVSERPLTIERGEGVIIGDDPAEPSDLVTHAATVRQIKGKPYVRVGDWQQPWSACE
jgi:hypothetical protein